MAEQEKSKCKSCGADVYWIQTENKTVIVDVTPVRSYVQVSSGPGRPVFALRTGYQSHFVSCPDAEEWRKQKGNR